METLLWLVLSDKSRPNQLRILKPSKQQFRGSAEYPNQNVRQIFQGVQKLLSDIQTDKQTVSRNYYF